MRRSLLLLPLVVLLGFGGLVAPSAPAFAQRRGEAPVLHEPIPPDAREDVALNVSLEGDIPAAINTPRGLVNAPDPAKPPPTGDSPYNQKPADTRDAPFHPDRDTRRPDVLPYDDPFSPSTAPFKRLSAFDSVDASYTLFVRDSHLVSLPVSPTPSPDVSEEQFYADLVVDLVAGQPRSRPRASVRARVSSARVPAWAARTCASSCGRTARRTGSSSPRPRRGRASSWSSPSCARRSAAISAIRRGPSSCR